MQAMLDDVRPDDGDLEGLACDRIGSSPMRASPQRRQRSGFTSTTWSGSRQTRSFRRWSGCPPRVRPEGFRGGAGFRCGGSLDGGRDEFEDPCLRRASSSAMQASCAAIRASSAATTAATTARASGGITSHVACGMTSGRSMPGRCSADRLQVNYQAVNGYRISLHITTVTAAVFERPLLGDEQQPHLVTQIAGGLLERVERTERA